MTAAIVKRSIEIAGHRTSISLEEPFWTALKEIADENGKTIRALVAEIDEKRGEANLSSAIRLYVLDVFRRAARG